MCAGIPHGEHRVRIQTRTCTGTHPLSHCISSLWLFVVVAARRCGCLKLCPLFAIAVHRCVYSSLWLFCRSGCRSRHGPHSSPDRFRCFGCFGCFGCFRCFRCFLVVHPSRDLASIITRDCMKALDPRRVSYAPCSTAG